MAYPKDELPPPESAPDDPRAFELLRLWFADGAPRLSARLDLWPDPAAWGVLLGEIARQLAGEVAERVDLDRSAVLERIRAGLVAELETAGDQDGLDEAPWGLRPGPAME